MRTDGWIFFFPSCLWGRWTGILSGERQEVCNLANPQKCSRHIMSSISYRNYGPLKKALGLPEVTEEGISLTWRGQAKGRNRVKKRNM